MDVDMLDEWGLLHNITKRVGDGMFMLFWKDSWLDESTLEACFSRLFELSDNKLATIADALFRLEG
jgi:hypothetical protein